jgi:mRNA-degrading endonuclease toxin of MazEF toxin-antitoxin module
MNLQFIPWEENRKKSTNVDEETINEILVAVRSSATFTEIAG